MHRNIRSLLKAGLRDDGLCYRPVAVSDHCSLLADSVEKVAVTPCRWQNCSVSERGGELLNVRKAQNDGDDDEHRRLTAGCYGRLRLAWERCVEEVLLNGAVQRFGEGVSTQRLKSVVVTDGDYQEVYTGMSKCSKFEHDAAASVGRLPMPDPDEVERDIDKLSAWRVALDRRLKETAKARG